MTETNGTIEEHKVTAEQVLRDALHHIETGWTIGYELVVDGKDSGLSYQNLTVFNEVTKPILDEGKVVRVCSIGGIFLARAILDGPSLTSNLQNDPVSTTAIRLVADQIKLNPNPVGKHRLTVSWGDWKDDVEVVTSYNDNLKDKRYVVRRFKRAIAEAERLGL